VVAPDTIAAAAAGTSSHVDVTAAASCTWTASSGAGWIGVTPAGGAGTGGVDLTIAANTGPARSGVVTIAERAVTVNQESGCVYGLSAAGLPVPVGGGNGFVNVTAGGGCPWTAASQVSWITVTAGASGTGDGPVQFAVEANGTGAPRAGTIAIAGLMFTVNQQ
jgi:Putative binding domain, N-terminal